MSDTWGPPIPPPDDAWAAAISYAVEASADDAADLADLVPPPPAPGEAHLWESSNDAAQESTDLDAEAGETSDLDADPLADDDDPGWATHHDPGLDPTVDSGEDSSIDRAAPDDSGDPGDAGGWA